MVARRLLVVRGDGLRTRVLGVGAWLACAGVACGQSFSGIGHPPGGTMTWAFGVSADGATVVGQARAMLGDRAFRWTEATGFEELGTLNGAPGSIAFAASEDGAVVVGYSGPFGFNSLAFRWTSAEGMRDLGLLPSGTSAYGYDVSASGAVVVGLASFGESWRGFRWEDGVMVPLEPLQGQVQSMAVGISADARVIAGMSGPHVVRWVQGSGIEDLGAPLSGSIEAYAISDDGSAVIVNGDNGTERRSLIWTHTREWQVIEPFPNSMVGGTANALNADASIVVGSSSTSDGSQRAVFWRSWQTAVDLQDYLEQRGVNLAGWNLYSAAGVSADGRTVVGSGFNPSGAPEAWIATLGDRTADFNDDGRVNSQDFFDYLVAFFGASNDADFNGDGVVNSDDFFAYLEAFFAAG